MGNILTNNTPIISDVCSILPGNFSPVSRVPSFYLAHIAFFVGFLLMNAAIVYAMPKDKYNTNVPESLYDNRRNRAFMTIVLLSVLYILIVLYRFNTSCESSLGIVFTSITYILLGVAWYKLAEYCGIRSADIFGVAPSIVPINATPYVCAKTS